MLRRRPQDYSQRHASKSLSVDFDGEPIQPLSVEWQFKLVAKGGSGFAAQHYQICLSYCLCCARRIVQHKSKLLLLWAVSRFYDYKKPCFDAQNVALLEAW